MFQMLGDQVNTLLGAYVNGVSATLASALVLPVAAAMTLYLVIVGLDMARGDVAVLQTVWEIAKKNLVLSVALGIGLYNSMISDQIQPLMTAVATMLSNGTGTPSVTSIWGMLDSYNEAAMEIIMSSFDKASEGGPTAALSTAFWAYLLCAVLYIIGTFVFLMAAIVCVLTTVINLAFILATGPLFIAGLLFRPTAKYFDNWVSSTLQNVLMAGMVFFVLGFAFQFGSQLLTDALMPAAETENTLGKALVYLIVAVIFAVYLYGLEGRAAQLVGGSTSPGLGHLMRDLAGGRFLLRGARAPSPREAGAAPPNLIEGPGRAHALGRAAGRGVRVAATTTAEAATATGHYMNAAYRQIRRRF